MIKEYLQDTNEAKLTERLNTVYNDKKNPSKLNKKIHQAQMNILDREEWD